VSEHTPEHERWLEELVLGAEGLDEGEIQMRREALESCGSCRVEWFELQGLLQDLTAVGTESRAVIAAAGRIDTPEGDRIVAASLRERLAAAGPGGRRGSLLPWVGLAAAGLLAALLLLREHATPGGGASPEDSILMGETLDARLTPHGPTESWDVPFTWTLEGDSYRVTVYGLLADGGQERLAESGKVYDRRWTWRNDETALWPQRIRWEVEVFDVNGLSGEPCVTEAWLSSR